MTDIEIQNEGTIVLFTPMSDAGRAWMTEYLPEPEPWQMLGGQSYAVEHRYAYDIVQGIEYAGLEWREA